MKRKIKKMVTTRYVIVTGKLTVKTEKPQTSRG